jgi:hypothetical protein
MNSTKLLQSQIQSGQPTNSQSVKDAINKLAYALEHFEIRTKKKSKLEWSNGAPILTIDET